jgi:hypothetical protein
VPDSSRYNSIRVMMVRVLGMKTASIFDGITSQRTDTFLQSIVYAKDVYDSKKRYETITIHFDTTLAVSVP